jgi:hypothetical protein
MLYHGRVSQTVHMSGQAANNFNVVFSWSGHTTTESFYCPLP